MGFQDFDISIFPTDHTTDARRPDLVAVDKNKTCKINNFAVLGDYKTEDKQWQKI